jgi:hypothetical protein
MVRSIQTSRCGLFWMRQSHCLLSRQQRHHQTVRAWTMRSQSYHQMSGRFHRQMACVWTMTIQSCLRMSGLLHQMVCVWTMSQSHHLMSECFHHQTMTVHQCYQTIRGYRMRIRMSCFPCGGQRCCSYTLAGCPNRRAQLDCSGNTKNSCSSRNMAGHQY